MRKVVAIGLLTGGLLLSLLGCSSSSTDKVDVYSVKGFSETEGESIRSFTDAKEIEKVREAFRRAKKQPGIVDMAEPQYRVEFETQTYYLWLDEEHGTIMNLKDTHTIYSLSKKNAGVLYPLLNR